MKYIRDKDNPAKGMMWHYVNPEDSFKISEFHYSILSKKVKEYRRNNNYPIGADFERQFEDNVCANADARDCVDSDVPRLAKRVASFTRAVAEWSSAGFPMRSQQEVDKILKEFCGPCEYYTGESSPFRIACRKCGCSSKKLMLKTENCPIGKW